MRLKKIADCKYTLEELVAEPKALDEVRHHLLKGTAFRIPHSISIFKLKEFKINLKEFEPPHVSEIVNMYMPEDNLLKSN